MPVLNFLGQGAGEFDVLDHRDVVLGGDSLDALGDLVVALGKDDGRGHVRAVVCERDGHVGRVGPR